MRERPTGEELLMIARKLLREELVPLLPEERRYDALMVANAMAIAARQIAFGDAPERHELQDLDDLLGGTKNKDSTTPMGDVLGDLYRRLGAQIRKGQVDPGTPCHDSVYAFLLDVTIQKLRESAPKALEEASTELYPREPSMVSPRSII
ncbi:DUF6285 domain-containing protein [Alphaproteobacteria bacterium]|nr:DUF6285 domain-containing protein [Alphaproteobacteria bacterium]